MSMPEIEILTSLLQSLPALKLGVLTSSVEVNATDEGLSQELDEHCRRLSSRLDAETIRNIPAVKASKDAYRTLGKDPNRYRPSAESLLRRISKGKGLYHVNTVVDCLNLASVKTGYSICGYDAAKIFGPVTLGIGQVNEPYEGIGRGELNIENLPVFRDEKGAFGTPTSDSVRTMIDEATSSVLMIIPSFDGCETELEAALEILAGLLSKFVKGASPQYKIL
ncbi:B3/B4 domain-containing protein [Thermophagus sp. OGC60D27]|uniref:B3/B4 domain-containing protein n=1 Tax=Thermophagus sp. OGC60D27 TaxID=3458415 RepID=UPI0040376B84